MEGGQRRGDQGQVWGGCSGGRRAGCQGQSQEEKTMEYPGLTGNMKEPMVSGIEGAQVHSPALAHWSCAALKKWFTVSEP